MRKAKLTVYDQDNGKTIRECDVDCWRITKNEDNPDGMCCSLPDTKKGHGVQLVIPDETEEPQENEEEVEDWYG